MHCGAEFGEGVREGTMLLALVLGGFQSLPPLPTSKLGPSSADFQVGDFVYILGPCGSLQQTLLWGWEFLWPLQYSQVLTARGFEDLFPCAGTLGCVVCLAPQLFLLAYLHTNVGPPGWSAAASPTQSSRRYFATCPLCPNWLSPPLLPVWMNVSSLTPWLLDFLTVWFSGSPGCFLFLNLLLSFFQLCEEAQCIYLCLHLGRKSAIFTFEMSTFCW